MSGARSVPGVLPRRSPGVRLLLVLGALVALDCVILAAALGDTPPRPTVLDAATGGFARGHSISSAWSFHGFDPRGVRDCESELFPIVGAPCCDPGHRASRHLGTMHLFAEQP